MPSNKDLIAAIEVEAETQGVDVPDTKGKRNEDLVEILKGMKQPAAPEGDENKGDPNAGAQDAADKKAETQEAKAKAEAEKEVKKPPYSVAPGHSVTTKRGMINENDEIKAEYLGGGKTSLEALVKAGHVVKN